jgi:presequence protease
LLSILQDILGNARLDNRGRFQQLVLEEKAALESRLVPAGSSYVDRRLRGHARKGIAGPIPVRRPDSPSAGALLL